MRQTESVKISKASVEAARKEAKEQGSFIGSIFERALTVYLLQKLKETVRRRKERQS